MDIIVYTTRKVLEHKKGSDGYKEYFWRLPRCPRLLNVGDRMYFACEGHIQGYFRVAEINHSGEETICFNADSWVSLDKLIPVKPFQGFKYASKVKGLRFNFDEWETVDWDRA